MDENKLGFVYESSALGISVKMDFKTFEINKENLVIGNFLKVSIGNHDSLLTSITGIKAIYDIEKSKESYILNVEVIGSILNGEFKAGSILLPTPTEPVYLANREILKGIFSNEGTLNFPVGQLSNNTDIEVFVEGNSFFGKHLAIVGSTGSGKSSTVAKILQTAVGISKAKNINNELKNSHIVIFDIHAEYESAFTIEGDLFSLNTLNIDNIILPYWLMNSEELESLFIETNEKNAYNQISQFRSAVVKNKQKYNKDIMNIKYDTPIYFNIEEVFNYITNVNNEVINKAEGLNESPYIIDQNGQKKEIASKDDYFKEIYKFIPTSATKAEKAIKGPFHGEFERFIIRLENKIKDYLLL
ncbi:ATP-binding protein [Staphylococcus caprae]|uniref:ATP-binding protein n=1 Tax=Staphylococcus caprae TaxID=29380 RepID=UPI003B20B62C